MVIIMLNCMIGWVATYNADKSDHTEYTEEHSNFPISPSTFLNLELFCA